jgi:membrane associated rhomboid family serine protease
MRHGVGMRGWLLLMPNIIYTLVYLGAIAWAAHLGGAIVGLVVGSFCRPAVQRAVPHY